MEQTKDIDINLNHDEALVFFEFLSREEDGLLSKAQHYAEQKTLSHILGTLEKALSEPFIKDYQELLDAAREKVQGGDEPSSLVLNPSDRQENLVSA